MTTCEFPRRARRRCSPGIRRVSAAVVVAATVQTGDWVPARPDYTWSFPRDHWAHAGYKTEWWYFTGTLSRPGDTQPRFGYQFTFFRVGVTPERPPGGSAWATSDLVMGHAAITDFAVGTHVFSELLYRSTPFLGGFGAPGDSLIGWSRAPPGTDDRWTLRWSGAGFDLHAADDVRAVALSLSLHPAKPLVLHGENGYSRKGTGPTAASHYYSFPRLATTGRIGWGGREHVVTGESWMDHEFGSNQLGSHQIGWDWLGLRLDDGRDLMLFTLRDSVGNVDFSGGTLVSRDGQPRSLAPHEFTLQATDRWRSTVSGAVYPSRWVVTVPSAGISVTLIPEVADQEIVATLVPNLFYWEGAVAVRDAEGGRIGSGYVELTGYGDGSRPAL